MKKLWLILLSLGLVMAFSVSAFAVDVKVSGEYYAAGLYLDKTNVKDDDTANSTAFFYQRLRVGTDFVVSPSLKLVTRFDAMERIWGGQRSPVDGGTTPATLALDSAGTRAENENIAVDWAYVNYVAPVGTFDVGYMNSGATGTIFGNSAVPAGRIKYYSPLIKDAININADITKLTDKSASAVTSANATDLDKDAYAIEGVYNFKNDKASGKAAFKIAYTRDATKRVSGQYKQTYFTFTPWAIAKIGPVALQAEINWATGDDSDYDTATGDVDLDNLSAFVDATATFAPVYVGATVAYVSGDDPDTNDKKEGGTLKGGRDWNPCLIMFNYYDTYNWVGAISGYDSVVNDAMGNAWFFQGRVGVRPTPQLDINLAIAYATADEKPTGYANSNYGTEVDITGTYKITNNLSYMLGAGYLFTGDYYKGKNTQGNNDVDNDFIVLNKLTLSF
ncbi:hypothetical protein ER57_14695 [Smithella sp. SCADC]|jgi:hypothetical protein|nr:hypothetical protein ER57_14695 [Smithella sp. SCADC]